MKHFWEMSTTALFQVKHGTNVLLIRGYRRNWWWEHDRCEAEAAVLRKDRSCSSCKHMISKVNTNTRWLR